MAIQIIPAALAAAGAGGAGAAGAGSIFSFLAPLLSGGAGGKGAGGVLGALQPPEVDTSRFQAAPAIAPPSASGGPDPALMAQLLALLQPQQAPVPPTLGQLIGGS